MDDWNFKSRNLPFNGFFSSLSLKYRGIRQSRFEFITEHKMSDPIKLNRLARKYIDRIDDNRELILPPRLDPKYLENDDFFKKNFRNRSIGDLTHE